MIRSRFDSFCGFGFDSFLLTRSTRDPLASDRSVATRGRYPQTRTANSIWTLASGTAGVIAAPDYNYISLTPPSSPESIAKAYSYKEGDGGATPLINEGLAVLFQAMDIIEKENYPPDTGVAKIEHAKPEVVPLKRARHYQITYLPDRPLLTKIKMSAIKPRRRPCCRWCHLPMQGRRHQLCKVLAQKNAKRMGEFVDTSFP